jgi:NAD(P)-dependent dehydrogenase (short-subunit alcohol dehydrogenase family)
MLPSLRLNSKPFYWMAVALRGPPDRLPRARTSATARVQAKDNEILSPMRVIEVFHDLVAENGVIAAMSSAIGSITNSSGFWELYSSSKAALNVLMKAFSERHSDDPRAPGWVRTEMGGEQATLEISDSNPLVIDMVERNAGIPRLRFTDRHGEVLPW